MTALTTLVILCIILVCFGPAMDLLVGNFRRSNPSKINKDGKRELKINRISFWDYLILIIPGCLLLIGLLSNRPNEKANSFALLGIGYMMLILSPYNRRIDIPKINWFLFSTCLTLAIVSYLLEKTKSNYSFTSGTNSLTILYFPAAAYIFLQTSRLLIHLTTGTFPITLDKNNPVGHFYARYDRKTTYWDLVWTIISLFGFPGLLIYLTLMK
jgi:hypothetical protein